MSVNPHADAERHANEQEAADEQQQEAERQAPLIILAALQRIAKPGDRFNTNLLSADRGWAPDEVLQDAVATDDDTLNAYVELLTGPHALKLRPCMATWLGNQHARDIYHEHREQLK